MPSLPVKVWTIPPVAVGSAGVFVSVGGRFVAVGGKGVLVGGADVAVGGAGVAGAQAVMIKTIISELKSLRVILFSLVFLKINASVSTIQSQLDCQY